MKNATYVKNLYIAEYWRRGGGFAMYLYSFGYAVCVFI